MQYPLLSEYVSAITHASENLDQLKHLEVVQDEHGEPYRSSGAFAVVFKMRDPRTGQLYALKCFTEEQEGRAEAYRKIEEELEVAGTTYFTSMRYYERELFVDSSVSSESEFPVLLMDWVEGCTMELYIREHYRDSYAMEMLCYRFCRLAAYLRSQPFAHGDVKPDNIMVSDTGTLTLIDYDGMFVPSMQGESSPTLGTEEFRHPLRTPELFDATIDDFALASIALSLRAIALDSQLLDQYGAPDRLLFSASDYRDLAQSKAMQAIWRLVSDKDLCKLMGLFVLAHAEQSLASTSFQLFSTTRPEKPVVVPLSTKVTDEDLAEAYIDEYGVKFSPDRKRLLNAPLDLVSYTIPDTVTTICDEAFSYCKSLTSLTIPDSVTSIGNRVFENCYSLTSLTIPDSVAYIGAFAFLFCKSLIELTIPKSVATIGPNPFLGLKIQLDNLSPHFYVENNVLFTADKKQLIAYCSTQTFYCIPNSVTAIGDCAFWGRPSVTSLMIPSSVTSIGDGAFCFCHSLTSLTIPNSVTSIGDGAFESCFSLTSLTIPDSVISIGDHAFESCLSLTSLTIPDSVTSIGNSAFLGCWSLTLFTIPDSVTSIGNSAFCCCSSLTSLTIPNSVTSIGDSAFEGCSRLTSLTIPNSVTTVGSNPFRELKLQLNNLSPHFCVEDNILFTADKKNLMAYCSTQTSYRIPNSVTSIGDSAFWECSSLTSLTIPDSVTAIGNKAFNGCSSLTSLTIHNSVTVIGDSAFWECSSLTLLTIPDSVTAIGDCAFWGCSSLTSLTIPKSVTTIESNPFIGLKLHLDNQSPYFYVEDNVLFTADKSKLIGYCSSQTFYSIPNFVTTIGDNAFKQCESLTSLTIPNSVSSIGSSAFDDCTSLTSLTIPNSVTTIENYAFYKCKSLIELTIPNSITTIGDSAFSDCSSLTSLTIPDSVTSIGNRAFDDCTSLTSLTIPSSVTSIGYSAFEDCSSLTSLTIPNSVIYIGDGALCRCNNLNQSTREELEDRFGKRIF